MEDSKQPATQGQAVKKALKGERNRDIDRWAGFSAEEAEERAHDPAPPEGAEKPLAGLARDGGKVDE